MNLRPKLINTTNSMKAKLILKSLADLTANALGFAAATPGRAMNVSKQILGPAVRLTRREIRTARRRSASFMREIYARASAPWPRGGLNE